MSETSSNAAAWVQAIGSVVAILVAVAVPWWQRHKAVLDKREDERRAARSMAAANLRYAKEFEKNLAKGQRQFDAASQRPHDMVGLSWIPIPQDLWDQVHLLHALGEPGGKLQQAIYHTLELRNLVHKDLLAAKDFDDYRRHLSKARQYVADALEAMHRLLR